MKDDLISRSALLEELEKLAKDDQWRNQRTIRERWLRREGILIMMNGVERFPAVDAVEVAELKEFAEDVLFQYGYKINCNGGLHITTGGLSVLETAFEILGWEDPHPFPEGECEVGGCHEYATCGTPTPDGYKRVCGKHFAVIQARKEAENAKMDGGKTDG